MLRDQKQAFAKKLAPHIARVFSQMGVSLSAAKACLGEAALYTGFGKFVLGNNYWGLRGQGDNGYYTITRVYRTPNTAKNGGYAPHTEKFAKFSTIDAGIRAWVKAKKV